MSPTNLQCAVEQIDTQADTKTYTHRGEADKERTQGDSTVTQHRWNVLCKWDGGNLLYGVGVTSYCIELTVVK